MTVQRVVLAAAGTLILLSVGLSLTVNPNFFWLAAFVGANLLQSALTRWCLMETIVRKLGAREDRRHLAGTRRRTGRTARGGRDPVDDRSQTGKLSERLAAIRELQPGATRVALPQTHVHETRVLADRAWEVALIRERCSQAAMGGEVGRRDRDGFEHQRHRRGAIADPGELRRALTKRRECGALVLHPGLRAGESGIRLDVAVLVDESAVRDLRVMRAPVLQELRRSVAGQAVSLAGGLLLLRRPARGHRGGELGCTLVAHRTRGLLAHALDQTFKLGGTDGVRVDAEGLEFGREECLRSRPEVVLRYDEQLLRKRVQSSPAVASSDNA